MKNVYLVTGDVTYSGAQTLDLYGDCELRDKPFRITESVQANILAPNAEAAIQSFKWMSHRLITEGMRNNIPPYFKTNTRLPEFTVEGHVIHGATIMVRDVR